MNVLFTSVGRRVELVQSFRRAFDTLELDGRIVAVDVDPLAPALQFVDHPYIVPRVDSPEYVPCLTEILRRERIGVVFPLIDPEIPVLAASRSVLEATGARLAVVPDEAVRIAGDKWQTCSLFRRLGLSTPKTWLPSEMDSSGATYPLFIKPRAGSASEETFKVADPGELELFRTRVSDPIIQEYVSGPEITNDIACDFNGEVLSVVSRERIRVRAGEVIVGRTVHHPDIIDGCVKIARTIRAVGPITIQCIMSRDRPVFIEINVRFGGGAPLGFAAGADSPRWLLARLARIPVEIPPLGAYETGLYLSRYDQSVLVRESERETMAGRRL